MICERHKKGTDMTNSQEELNGASGAKPTTGELRSMVDGVASHLRIVSATSGEAAQHAIPGAFDFRLGVRSARSLRKLRRSLFGNEMYSGPAWEILLHLFESHVLERRDTVGNVTDGTELPGATSLRWMARLEQEGLVRLRDDHLDRRRRWVELTDAGVELLTKYFSGAAPHPIAA
jgi:DNA-binding MarR family transcriptional regulator